MELLQNFTFHISQLQQFVIFLGVSFTCVELLTSYQYKHFLKLYFKEDG